MKQFLLFLIIISSLINFAACSSGNNSALISHPALVAVDSTNDRLFVIENEKVLVALTASTRSEIGTEPLVDDETNTTIQDLLPITPTNMAAISVGSTTRLFITGTQANSAGTQVTNQILVLDFDGTTLGEASLSPITVDDGDSTTDDTDNVLGGLRVDATNSRLYVTDTSLATLFTYSTSDGTAAVATLTIAGSPNRMSLDGTHLYVANSSSTAVEEVITVVNTTDFSTTQISLGVPTNDISVLSNDTGTVLLAKQSNEQKVLVETVDTSTFASASAIAAGDSSVSNGFIDSTAGITGSVGQIVLAKDSSGVLYGYCPQSDGNIEILTIEADLSSFIGTENETSTSLLNGIDVYVNSSNIGQFIYMAATGSGDLVYNEVGSPDDIGATF